MSRTRRPKMSISVRSSLTPAPAGGSPEPGALRVLAARGGVRRGV
ncbi:hypothetical protein AB0D94_16765 [Streptomyces sp. NPDC048255]